MHPYRLAPSSAPEYCAVAYSRDYTRPDESLESLAQDLLAQGLEGAVLFDLLLANGSGRQRYFVTTFAQGEFGRFSRLEPVPDGVRQASADFYLAHLPEVDPSLLSRAQQFALTRGIAIHG